MSITIDIFNLSINLFTTMQRMFWITLFLIINCAHRGQELHPPAPNLPQEMINKLENGFGFKWDAKREKGGIITTLKASGVYKGGGDYEMKAALRIGDIEESIFDIDPYIELKNLCGKDDFEFTSRKNGEYVYSFTANLTLLSPGGKEGKGQLLIGEKGITRITAKTEDIEWQMKIEPLKGITRKSLTINKDIDPLILKQRLEYFGERRVEIKGAKIYFEKTLPIRKEGLLLKKGKYSIFALKREPEGELFLSPDSIERYTPIRKIEVEIEDARMREDEHGEYWITIHFNKPAEGDLTGIVIEKELFGIGHSSGKTLRFIVRNYRLAKEIYAVLKSGPL